MRADRHTPLSGAELKDNMLQCTHVKTTPNTEHRTACLAQSADARKGPFTKMYKEKRPRLLTPVYTQTRPHRRARPAAVLAPWRTVGEHPVQRSECPACCAAGVMLPRSMARWTLQGV